MSKDNEQNKPLAQDTRKRTYAKKRGRPAGSRNNTNIPTSTTILKMTEENFELALQEIRFILEDNPLEGQKYSEKAKEMALKTSIELGKYFKELELSGKLSGSVPDTTEAKPEVPTNSTTKKSQVFALAAHTGTK